MKFVVCFDHWPQLSLNVICFTFFYQIYLVLNGNPQKWQNGSHLWWKQQLSIQRNPRHSLTYQVSKFMKTLSNLKVKLIMFHKSILKDDDILSLWRKKCNHNIYQFVMYYLLQNDVIIFEYWIGCTSQTLNANAVRESTYAFPEKTKKGPPTNKDIPVRNMKAQITNMSINENAGFKSEYHVYFIFSLNVSFFYWLYIFLNLNVLAVKNIYNTFII